MVILVGLHLADGLGVRDTPCSRERSLMQAAVGIGVGRVAPQLLVGSVVIPRLHDEMGGNLFEAHRFGSRVGWDEASMQPG